MVFMLDGLKNWNQSRWAVAITIQNATDLFKFPCAINCNWRSGHLMQASVWLDWNLVAPRKLPGERSEGRVQILVVNNDVCRYFESYRSEVTDCLDAALDHFIGDALRKFSWSGDDAEIDAHALGEIGEFIKREHCLAVDPLADLVGIGVERSNNTEAEVREALVSQKGSPKIADADKEGVIDVVPAQETFNGLDQLGDGIAGFGFADNARVLKIFAYLDSNQIEIIPDNAAGYPAESLAFKLGQIVVVLRQPIEAWLGNPSGAARLRSYMNR